MQRPGTGKGRARQGRGQATQPATSNQRQKPSERVRTKPFAPEPFDNDGEPIEMDEQEQENESVNKRPRNYPAHDYGNDGEDGLGEGRERDIVTGDELLPPAQFRSENFVMLNIDLVTEYAEYRVQAHQAERAFLRVFGTDYADVWIGHRIDALESTRAYQQIFARLFAEVKVGDMYSAKESVYRYLLIINDPFAKYSDKQKAQQHLDVLYGHTSIDDKGRAVKGEGMGDFYKTLTQPATATEPVTEHTRHPIPGSPEAEAFMEATGGSGAKKADSAG